MRLSIDIAMGILKRALAIALTTLAIFFFASFHFNRGLSYFRVPRVLAQGVFQQYCPSSMNPVFAPDIGMFRSQSSRNAIQTSCVDQDGNVLINGAIYVPSGGNLIQAIADNQCHGEVRLASRFVGTINSDPFAAYHSSNVCDGELLLTGGATLITNSQIVEPDTYSIAGTGMAQALIEAGRSFPQGDTVGSGRASRHANVVSMTLLGSHSYPAGLVLFLNGFSWINGYCVVRTSSGTSVKCLQQGASVSLDGSGTVDVPVVVIGDTFEYGRPTGDSTSMMLERVAVSCSDLAHTVGFYSDDLNENTGAEHVISTHCTDMGAAIYGDNVGTPQNYILHDLCILLSVKAGSSAKGLMIHGTISRQDVSDITVVDDSPTLGADGVYVDSANGLDVRDLHCENFAICGEIAGGPNTTWDDVFGNSQDVTLMKIDSGAGGFHTLLHLSGNGTTNTIINADQSPPLTITANLVQRYEFLASNECFSTELTAKCANPLGVYTVSTLPIASSVGAGASAVVSDSRSFTVGSCIGGGSDYMVAISNGHSWTCH